MISSQPQSSPSSSLSSYFTKKPTRSVKHHETLTIKNSREKKKDSVNETDEGDVLTAVIARMSKIKLSPHAPEFAAAACGNVGDSAAVFTFSFSEGSVNEASKKTLRRRQRRRNTTNARRNQDGVGSEDDSDEGEEETEGSEVPLVQVLETKAQPIPPASKTPLKNSNDSYEDEDDEEELYTTPEEALKAMASEIPEFDPEVDTIGPMITNEEPKKKKKKNRKKKKKPLITSTTESELTPLPPKPIFSPTLKPLLSAKMKTSVPPGYEHFITTAHTMHTLGNGSINFNENDIKIGRRVDWGFVRHDESRKDKEKGKVNTSLNLAGDVKLKVKTIIPIAVVNKARLMERKAKAKSNASSLASAAGAADDSVGGLDVDDGKDNGVIGGEILQTKSAFGFGFNF